MRPMFRATIVCVAMIAGTTFANAAPGLGLALPASMEGPSDLLVTVATKKQRAEAWRICRARYGKRTFGATYVKPGVANCTFGQTKRKLSSRAAARCKKKGKRLKWLGPINRKTVSYRCG